MVSTKGIHMFLDIATNVGQATPELVQLLML